MGLKKEKEKQSSRVAETRGKRLKDLVLDEDDELEDGGATPDQQSSKTSVRALSQRFNPNTLSSPASVGTPLQQVDNEATSRSNSPIRPRDELKDLTPSDSEGNGNAGSETNTTNVDDGN
jgi:hypothetical protein